MPLASCDTSATENEMLAANSIVSDVTEWSKSYKSLSGVIAFFKMEPGVGLEMHTLMKNTFLSSSRVKPPGATGQQKLKSYCELNVTNNNKQKQTKAKQNKMSCICREEGWVEIWVRMNWSLKGWQIILAIIYLKKLTLCCLVGKIVLEILSSWW